MAIEESHVVLRTVLETNGYITNEAKELGGDLIGVEVKGLRSGVSP